MCSRGVYQLKQLYLQYCDLGGSSKGMRLFLKSAMFEQFRKENPQILYDIGMKRNAHPHISSIYINGYIKELQALNQTPEEILEGIYALRNSFGRKPLPVTGKRVHGYKKSIQGLWTENFWNKYPKIVLERNRQPPLPDIRYELIDNKGKKEYVDHTDLIRRILKVKNVKPDYLNVVQDDTF